MKTTGIAGIILGLLIWVFVFTVPVFAQTSWDVLDGQWFKTKFGVKGYVVHNDGETVLGKLAGGGPVYVRMVKGSDEYDIVTCMENRNNPGQWIMSKVGSPVRLSNMFGSVYPELWDFDGNSLGFNDGNALYAVYPILYIKMEADVGGLKKAKMTAVGCSSTLDFVGGDYAGMRGYGSCKLTGSAIATDKIISVVPQECRR